MLKRVTILASILALPGCAGTMGYVFDPAISSDKLDERLEPNKLKSMKGDRRLIGTHRRESDIYEICAETHADAISARSGASKLTIVDRGSLDDALTEALTKTVERGAVSDTTRHLHWNTCNARLNRWITDAQYLSEIQEIRKGAFQALAPAPPKEAPKAAGAATGKTTTTTTTTTKK